MTDDRNAPATEVREIRGAEQLVNIAIGYMGAKQLFAAEKVGLFPALADGPRTAAELANELGLQERVVRILADSMNSLGLLERENGRYSNGEAARVFLQGGTDVDLGPFFAFLNAVSYEQWLQFDDSVQSGEHGVMNLEGKDMGMLGRGIGAFQTLHAAQFVESFDVSPYRNLLDLGGQSSRFAINAMKANPELRTTFVYDVAEDASIQAAVDAAGVADRSTVSGADTVTAEPQGSFDLVLLNHCIHRFTGEENVQILKHVRAAAAAGAKLVIVDFVLDDEPRQRAVDALHAAEYMVIDSTVAYPVSEIEQWFAQTGWKLTESIALPGSPRALIAEAV